MFAMRAAVPLALVTAGLLACSQGPQDRIVTRPSSEAEATAVFAQLQARPAWLYPADKCPADVWQESENGIDDVLEDCRQHFQSCLDRCATDDGNACHALAQIVWAQQTDGTTEQALFLRACRLGNPSGCTLGALQMTSPMLESEERLACAARTFKLACAEEDPFGCAMYAGALTNGKGVPRNVDLALQYFRRSCELDENEVLCGQLERLTKEAEEKNAAASP